MFLHFVDKRLISEGGIVFPTKIYLLLQISTTVYARNV